MLDMSLLDPFRTSGRTINWGPKRTSPILPTSNIANAIYSEYSQDYIYIVKLVGLGWFSFVPSLYIEYSVWSPPVTGVMSPYSPTLTTILAGVLQHDTKLNPVLQTLCELYVAQMCPPLLIGQTCIPLIGLYW